MLIHGRDDPVCKVENAVKFFERVESKDKEMILLDGSLFKLFNLFLYSIFFNLSKIDVYHDVIKDRKHREIANDVIKFMDKNLL